MKVLEAIGVCRIDGPIGPIDPRALALRRVIPQGDAAFAGQLDERLAAEAPFQVAMQVDLRNALAERGGHARFFGAQSLRTACNLCRSRGATKAVVLGFSLPRGGAVR